MNTDALRTQIRATLQAQRAAHARPAPAQNPSEPATGAPDASSSVVIPLRLGSAQDTGVLTQLFQRLAASPALLKMADAGWLRFDLRVDAAALGAGSTSSAMAASTTTAEPAACCPSCKEGKACECNDTHCARHPHTTSVAVPELQGVVGEKLLKTVPPGVQTVRIHPKAVLTPLGKEALRKRGITIDRGATP